MSHTPSDVPDEPRGRGASTPAEAPATTIGTGHPTGPHDAARPAAGGARGRRGWLVPVVVAVVVVVLAAAGMLLLGRNEIRPADTASPAATPSVEPAGAPTGSSGTPTESTAPSTEDTRAVSPDPLEPRVDTAVPGTAFALTPPGWVTDDAATAAGAREAIAGTYSDGATEVPVTAAAFDSLEAQDAYSAGLVAALDAAGAAKGEDAHVYEDGSGHYWYYLLADGVTATLVWRTDNGVVLRLIGPSDAVAQIYENMTI